MWLERLCVYRNGVCVFLKVEGVCVCVCVMPIKSKKVMPMKVKVASSLDTAREQARAGRHSRPAVKVSARARSFIPKLTGVVNWWH